MTKDSSWEKSHEWYDSIVGKEGHYYHKEIILPGALRLLDLKSTDHLLDVGCGQGVLARAMPKGAHYTGIDAAPSLIKLAQSYPGREKKFLTHDATKPFPLKKEFTKACMIMSLQNMERQDLVIKNISEVAKEKSSLLIVLNHPCFRIPRQSSWGIDEQKKIQYRRIDRYMSPLNIPIQTSPGQKNTEHTVSFHHPLGAYTKWLMENNFHVTLIEEWCSNKTSTGKYAKMENRSREEFPLFLAILAGKSADLVC